MNTGIVTGGVESSKPNSNVSEFKSNQVNSFWTYSNVYKSQMPSMLSFSSKFATIASSVSNPVVSHTRPLSPHLSIYKPQLSSMLSISNRIVASLLSCIALLFYMMCMKTFLICLTFNSFYQLLFGLNWFSMFISSLLIPCTVVPSFHVLKEALTISILITRS